MHTFALHQFLYKLSKRDYIEMFILNVSLQRVQRILTMYEWRPE